MIKNLILIICASFFYNIAFCRTIEFVVSGSAGSSADVLSRKIAKEIKDGTDLDIVVINRPGASHNIAYSYISTTDKPVIIITQDTIITNKNKPGYPDSIIDVVEPLFYIGEFTNAMIVNSNSKFKNLNDIINESKIRDIKIGHGGIGTYGHKAAQIACTHILYKCMDVPYKTGGSALLDILNGSIDVFIPVTFGLPEILENTGYRGVSLFATTPHPSLTIQTLPPELKHLEEFGWLMIFQKNLTLSEKTSIIKTLKSLRPKYYTSFGLWYQYKHPKEIWSKYANTK